MDLRQLRNFVTVAEQSSFTRAARILGVAQPAVSTAIKKLETELGLVLLHRQDKRVQLTAEGQELLPHAKEILSRVELAESAMTRLQQLGRGEVRIALPGMIGSYYFPALLMAFHHRYPELKLSLIEAGTREIQSMIERDEIDIGIVIDGDAQTTLETIPLTKEEMIVACSLDHPLAELESVNFEDFMEHELVMFKRGYYHRERMDQLAKAHNLEPQLAFETNLIELIRSIVRQGFAITTVLKMVVENDPQIKAISFEEPLFMDLHVAWKRGRALTQADRTFLDFLLEQRDTEKSL
ncbi:MULTISPECIES: LysR family transcriptional regulator [Ferrimonas]|uniref:DNA-binding transcriptional regulator, LysR family n=1 Tax=Ferrimonas sediminum TaxID=718193 RepID=A0A1G9ARR8_9GAMM|nr:MULTISPECIES: LysR family transcriptional regulator [Ferrimonas]USD38578.1 LysR family transcriptional regulator [Ferrimonas sp. SCSIO 43195]SDK29998.1 DNA-binding transcriptional regulator, LysR family [Ferrimonas sediminum]